MAHHLKEVSTAEDRSSLLKDVDNDNYDGDFDDFFHSEYSFGKDEFDYEDFTVGYKEDLSDLDDEDFEVDEKFYSQNYVGRVRLPDFDDEYQYDERTGRTHRVFLF